MLMFRSNSFQCCFLSVQENHGQPYSRNFTKLVADLNVVFLSLIITYIFVLVLSGLLVLYRHFWFIVNSLKN